jgi:exodeoxyribonuclease III
MNNTLSIYSWNINGIRAAYKKGFLDWLVATQPDIVCLQETKIQAHQLTADMIEPPGGYYAYYSHATRPGYSGTAIFTKQQPLSVKTGFGVEQFDTEGRSVIAEFDDFVLFSHYYPNGASSVERLTYKMAFYEAWQAHVESVRGQGKAVIITGDVNTAHREIDLARPKDNVKVSGFLPQERAWMDQFLALGYVDTFRYFHPDATDAYTWWHQVTRARDRNVGWRIDYFFVDQAHIDRVQSAAIHSDVMGSDHCPISIELAVYD